MSIQLVETSWRVRLPIHPVVCPTSGRVARTVKQSPHIEYTATYMPNSAFPAISAEKTAGYFSNNRIHKIVPDTIYKIVPDTPMQNAPARRQERFPGAKRSCVYARRRRRSRRLPATPEPTSSAIEPGSGTTGVTTSFTKPEIVRFCAPGAGMELILSNHSCTGVPP